MEQECEGSSRAGNVDLAEPIRRAFNFDEWEQLARENPAEFERRREQLVREVTSHMNDEPGRK